MFEKTRAGFSFVVYILCIKTCPAVTVSTLSLDSCLHRALSSVYLVGKLTRITLFVGNTFRLPHQLRVQGSNEGEIIDQTILSWRGKQNIFSLAGHSLYLSTGCLPGSIKSSIESSIAERRFIRSNLVYNYKDITTAVMSHRILCQLSEGRQTS